MAEAIIEVNGLFVSYRKIKALQGVSINVKKGECVAIVGANGAGKSSLLKAIMGLVGIEKGDVKFKGIVVNSLPTYKRAELGLSFVPEGARVFPKISVLGNLVLGAYKIKDKKIVEQRMQSVFDLFPRLKERQNQLAATLSGGERQMLALARALMGDPELLMIDEISLGLMPKLVDEVFDVVEDLHNRGSTILLSEQNAHKASEVADRIYILELGRVVKKTDKDGLFADPEIVKAYLGM